jgi:hypothetical protein
MFQTVTVTQTVFGRMPAALTMSLSRPAWRAFSGSGSAILFAPSFAFFVQWATVRLLASRSTIERVVGFERRATKLSSGFWLLSRIGFSPETDSRAAPLPAPVPDVRVGADGGVNGAAVGVELEVEEAVTVTAAAIAWERWSPGPVVAVTTKLFVRLDVTPDSEQV